MLINLSNHPSEKWSENQLCAAHEAYGDIMDFPFPEIDAAASEDEICTLALDTANEITAIGPTAVLCQGEYSFTFAVTAGLIRRGIPVICATSVRRAIDAPMPDGSTQKQIIFRFERFREYKAVAASESIE